MIRMVDIALLYSMLVQDPLMGKHIDDAIKILKQSDCRIEKTIENVDDRMVTYFDCSDKEIRLYYDPETKIINGILQISKQWQK